MTHSNYLMIFVFFSFVTVLAQMLSEEGIVRKEDLVKFLAEVDVDPSPENLNSLFHQVL